MDRSRVLFLCTGNSCRSQMAEGWARHVHPHVLLAYSAGVVKQGVDPGAVKVMSEAGVDISGQRSKTIEELPEPEFDAVITLCDEARESCPFFRGAKQRLHRTFHDPAALAPGSPDEGSALQVYRRVRDEIRDFVQQKPHELLLAPEACPYV